MTILVLLAAIAAAPATRYPVLAFAGVRQPFRVTVMDSKTGSPVSGAAVTLDGKTLRTDSAGRAAFTARVGQRTVAILKQYYRSARENVLVDIPSTHNVATIRLAATGRQVPVQVLNKITGKPLAGAEVQVLDTEARTDARGQAVIALPTGQSSRTATITAAGYNNLTATVQVTAAVVAGNTFALTPAGRVYFLSNLNGTIDVVSANLDGTGRKTVLAGTGSEDASATALIASSDWQYLALLSKRSGGQYAKLYLITTATGQLSTIDATAATFTPLGWSGHDFIYQASHVGTAPWQPGGTTIASYDADIGKASTLASTDATGTSNADAEYQNVWDAVLSGDTLVYATTWYAYPGTLNVSGKQDALLSIHADGTGGKTLKSVDAGQYYISNLKLASPGQCYFGVYSSGSSAANYYRLDADGNITQSSTITSASVTQDYPAYLASPSGNSTFWSESRDGKNTLFVGDAAGSSGAQIASLSDETPYGWFTDAYVLVQKGGSELYVMPVAGGTPMKISDYYQPPLSFYGYGGA